jgi:hypothetical protein
MIPRGGSAVRRNIPTIAKGNFVRSCVKKSAAGMARRVAAPKHRKIPSRRFA